MEPAIKIGTMVIVLKSTLGMEGAIGEVIDGPTKDVNTGNKLWVVKFPRECKAYLRDGRVIPSNRIYLLEAWIKPVSGLPISDEEQETKLKEEVV